MIAHDDKRESIVVELKHRANGKADANFPVLLSQPFQAQAVGALSREEVIQQAVNGFDGLSLNGARQLPKRSVVASEVLNDHAGRASASAPWLAQGWDTA